MFLNISIDGSSSKLKRIKKKKGEIFSCFLLVVEILSQMTSLKYISRASQSVLNTLMSDVTGDLKI